MDVKENLLNDNHIVFLLDSKCPFKYVSDRESIGRMKNKWNENEKSCRDERGKVPKERKRVSDNKPYVLLFHKYTSNFGEKHSPPITSISTARHPTTPPNSEVIHSKSFLPPFLSAERERNFIQKPFDSSREHERIFWRTCTQKQIRGCRDCCCMDALFIGPAKKQHKKELLESFQLFRREASSGDVNFDEVLKKLIRECYRNVI